MLSRIPLTIVFAIGAKAQLGLRATIIHQDRLANGTKYDFIIVGAGIAGLTVADRLTENANVSVLVLEYGPFDKREDTVMVPGSYFPVPYLWLPLMSTPQKALNGTTYSVPCGRVVGGGSVVNAMFFQRSDARLYNMWQELGAKGWGWKDLLPYFQKSNKFHPPPAEYAREKNITWDEDMYGFYGPVQSSMAPYDYPGSAHFFNAARSLGFQQAQDPNNGVAQGIFRLTRAINPKTRRRSSARVNRHDRIEKRPNYHILANTAVSRVLFEGNKAKGVEYMSTANGTHNIASASKEVVLAAGAVHTPQILQLSGIGDASYLKRFNISVVSDLPGLGQNLQDHLMLLVHYNYTNNLFPNGDGLASNTTFAIEQRTLYDSNRPSAYDLTLGTGNLMLQLPLSNWTSSSHSIIAAARASNAADAFCSTPPATVLNGYMKQRKIILRELNNIAVSGVSWNTGSETRIYMTRPLSRGSIKINSTSILSPPLVDYGALCESTDLSILYSVYMTNRRLISSPHLSILGPREVDPAPGITDESEVKEALKRYLQPSNAHQCCTAAMMAREDGGVVDEKNRVHGVKGLSVVDASIWSINVGNAPMASVYAGAEKAADLIKRRHGL